MNREALFSLAEVSLELYKSDIAIDRQYVKDFPNTPFFYTVAAMHTIIDPLYPPEEYPTFGTISYLFGRVNRRELLDRVGWSLESMEPCFARFYVNGDFVKLIDTKIGKEIVASYRAKILEGWKA